MFRRSSRQRRTTCWAGLLGGMLLALGGLQAQEADFEDLRSKLTIDYEPIEKTSAPVLSYADMLDRVMPSVVTISSKREQPSSQLQDLFNDPLFKRLFPDRIPEDGNPGPTPTLPVTGSGVIITSDGYILTNNHVVEKSKGLEVRVGTLNREFEAELVAADPKSDVALIKIDAQDLPAIALGDSTQLRVGDVTFAIGNPFGLDQTVTMGIVSALGRSSADVGLVDYADFIQTDAAINRGNSGGALIDAKGRLVGINTAIQGGLGGGNVGIGFAIPSNMALQMVQKLIEGGGVVRRGFLGVQLERLDRDMAKALGWRNNHGVAVTQVFPRTPASKAGFKPYDIIATYEGKKALSPDSLRLVISNTPPDEEVTFGLFRKGKMIEVDLRLAELPNNPEEFFAGGKSTPSPAREFLDGVSIVNLTEENRAANDVAEDLEGVLVDEVEVGSAAAEAGLVPGMVILDVNQTSVSSVKEAMTVREEFEGDVLLLRVSVRGSSRILTVRLTE